MLRKLSKIRLNNYQSWAKKLLPLVILLSFYIAFSFVTFKDFGITFDERTEYLWGSALKEHYSQTTSFLNSIAPIYEGEEKHQRHSPILSQYYRLYPAVISALNFRNTYEFYHLLNMLFGSLIIVTSYAIFLSISKNPWKASLAPIFILVVPRFLGHIPTNPKDVPFAIIYFLGLFGIYFSEKIKDRLLKILLLGILFGFVQSFRIVGFTIYPIYMAWLFYLTSDRDFLNLKINWKQILRTFIIENSLYLLLLSVVANFIMLTTWPYLGVNYFKNFFEILVNSKSYSFWDKSFLFNGEMITVGTRPWYYIPLWLLITTPFGIILNFLFSIKPKKDEYRDITFLLKTTIIINFLLYAIAKPNIYNGLRHYIFLLPTISSLAAIGFLRVIETKAGLLRSFVIGFTVVNFVIVGLHMWKLHPYEYIYFNGTTNGVGGAKDKFEIDYWGGSYKESVEWLNQNVQTEDAEKVKVYTCANSFAVEYFLSEKFVRTPNLNEAAYGICDDERKENLNNMQIIYEVIREDIVLNVVATKAQ